jgi:3-oxoacyl-[acyl-carrier protein] reductase
LKLSDEVKESMLKYIPLGKMGSSENVADLAVFFAGDDSAYITGQALQIDGGMRM